jgi:hypothetical protein
MSVTISAKVYIFNSFWTFDSILLMSCQRANNSCNFTFVACDVIASKDVLGMMLVDHQTRQLNGVCVLMILQNFGKCNSFLTLDI